MREERYDVGEQEAEQEADQESEQEHDVCQWCNLPVLHSVLIWLTPTAGTASSTNATAAIQNRVLMCRLVCCAWKVEVDCYASSELTLGVKRDAPAPWILWALLRGQHTLFACAKRVSLRGVKAATPDLFRNLTPSAFLDLVTPKGDPKGGGVRGTSGSGSNGLFGGDCGSLVSLDVSHTLVTKTCVEAIKAKWPAAELNLHGCWRLHGDHGSNPALPAADVVELQLLALKGDVRAGNNEGLATCFSFASPGNAAATGPLSKFSAMIRTWYPELLEEWSRCEIIALPLHPDRHPAEAVDRIQFFTVNLFAAVAVPQSVQAREDAAAGGGDSGGGGTCGRCSGQKAANADGGSKSESEKAFNLQVRNASAAAAAAAAVPSSVWSWYVTLEEGVHPDGPCWMTSAVQKAD